MHRFSLLIALAVFPLSSFAADIRVAVASNFHSVLNDLALEFEAQSEHRVFVTSGSSGQLASQILQGAPFDLFLSADVERIAFLRRNNIGRVDGSMIYALGKLAVVSHKELPLDDFRAGNFERIAVANPDLAPYGRAAQEALDFFNLELPKYSQVTANNVAQAFHYWRTGNVDMALVGMAQVIDAKLPGEVFAEIPQDTYSEIQQQMLLISNLDAAHDFFRFLQSEQAATMMSSRGYLVPRNSQ